VRQTPPNSTTEGLRDDPDAAPPRLPTDPTAAAGADRSAETAERLPLAIARRVTDGGERPVRDRPTDRALQLLLLSAEREDPHVGLTVTVGGTVVTGTLVGTLSYCRAFADQFASAVGGTEMDDRLADSFHDLVEDAVSRAHGDRRFPPDAVAYEQSVAFLHLLDARYVTASGLLPHGRHGVLWRGAVCDVTGWSLGALTPG
jgi:hypothetical protein